MRGGHLLAILASLVVIGPALSAGASGPLGPPTQDEEPLAPCDGKIPHPPIRIADNLMFRLGPAVGVVNPAAAGTAEDPFVIEGWCITPLFGEELDGLPIVPSLSVGILIEDTDAHVVIRDTVIPGDPDRALPGVLPDASGPQDRGIDLQGTTNVTVSATQIRDHAGEGIHARDSAGIAVEASRVTGNEEGIEVYESSDVDLRSNEAVDNEEEGLLVDQTGATTLVENTVRDNGGEGVYADLFGGALIAGNEAIDNADEGLKIYDVSDATIAGNTVRANGERGMYILPGDNVTVSSNQIEDNAEDALHVVGASDLVVSDNSVGSNGGHGIEVDVSSIVSIENNTVRGNSAGVAVDETTGATVANNTIDDNGQIGVSVFQASGTEVDWNRITGNEGPGITVHDSSSTGVHGNDIEANDEGLEVGRGSTNATGNWWGASDGPSGGIEDDCRDETATGSGQALDLRLDGAICFAPWLESPNPDAGTG